MTFSYIKKLTQHSLPVSPGGWSPNMCRRVEPWPYISPQYLLCPHEVFIDTVGGLLIECGFSGTMSVSQATASSFQEGMATAANATTARNTASVAL